MNNPSDINKFKIIGEAIRLKVTPCFHWLRLRGVNPLICYLLGSALLWALLPSIKYAATNYDDIYLLARFGEYSSNHNIAQTALHFGFPQDLTHEYRTYGLSRLIELLIWYIFKENPVPYQFLMIAGQFLSALLLFNLAQRLTAHREVSFFASCIWFCNPFTFPQVFHYFSYLLFPAYLILGYVWLNMRLLKYSNLESRAGKAVREMVCASSLFGILFTGEATLPLFFWIALLFLFYCLHQRRYLSALRLSAHFVASIAILTAHHALYTRFVMEKNLQQRFNPSLPTFAEACQRLENNFWILTDRSLAKQILVLLSEMPSPKAPNFTAVCLATVAGILLLVSLAYLICKNEKPTTLSFKVIATGASLCVSSLLLYLLLSVTDPHFGMVARYLSLPSTLFLCVCVACIYWLFNRPWLARIITGTACSFFIFLGSIHYYAAVPKMRKWERQITSAIIRARMNGKHAVLIANTYIGTRTPVPELQNFGFINQNDFSAQTSFAPYWMIQWYMKLRGGFDYVGCSFDELDQDHVLLKGTLSPPTIFRKDEVFVLGTKDFGYFLGTKRHIAVRSFFNWKQFKNSSQYYGVDIYTPSGAGTTAALPIQSNCLIAVDFGEQSNPPLPFLCDQHYSSSSQGIHYGYVSGDDALNTASRDPFFPYFTTVRYGNFTYRFDKLPPKANTVVLDFLEQWRGKIGDRVFDVSVTTDQNSFTLNNLDTFEIGKKLPTSLAIHLPTTTSVEISLKKKPGSMDVPFLSGVRILSQ